jgi:ATP-dependent RNA helicase DeaD
LIPTKEKMFNHYALSERVLKTLQDKGFTTPTAIQSATLNDSLAGRDILGQARTGTGKTLAFALPIVNRLETDRSKGRAPRAFILTPTRELALQVAGELEWLGKHLKIVTVYGGTGYSKQHMDLSRGSDVVVATPGRAIDYLERDVLDLSRVEVVVLDEADEMLSMGFEEDVEKLLSATPSERQTMLYSATLPAWAKKISHDYLRDPVHVNLIKDEKVSYEEIAIEANANVRLNVLSDVLHAHFGDKAIIFTHTKAEVDDLAQALNSKGHSAEAIHGDLNQTQRERVISRFRSGQVNILIGTNVAARGLDIPEVDLVVHYRIPAETEAYQHRSGRTGRAGRSGTVVLLYSNRERRELEMLERTVSRRFKRESAPTPDKVQHSKVNNLLANAKAQHSEDKAIWEYIAKDLIANQDTDTLAGIFALMLGGAPEAKSLLTQETGWVTLKLEGRIFNVGQVVRALREAGVTDVGRIQLAEKTAFVDVKTEYQKVQLEGYKVFKATHVPGATINRKDERSDRRDSGSRARLSQGNRKNFRREARAR